jgi:uncharacterized membrane-anchored protein YitT (DUF2179 family)
MGYLLSTKRDRIKEFLLINIGVLIMSVGIYFFKFPNNFSIGGVSGISILMGGIFPGLKPGKFVLVTNMLLLIVGFMFFGKKFGIKTTYASIAFSAEIWLLEVIFPMTAPFTNQPLLELVFAVLLPAVGSAILFNNEASSGGTDVIAMILKKYTSLDIGKALLLSDSIITVSAIFVFGVEVGLFSIAGLLAKAFLVDSVIENININKFFTIITTKPDEICEFINNDLNRGATIQDAQGAFTHLPKTVIVTVVNRPQAVRLQRHIRSVDPDAFILITNTSEIIGKGFRGVSL